MTIKSTSFGHTELSGKDAARFIRHMLEDEPNEKIKYALKQGRKVFGIVNPNLAESLERKVTAVQDKKA